MIKYEAIGVIETQYFAIASEILDNICKGANVEFLTAEKYLGGRLVSLIIGGSVSDVKAAIDISRQVCEDKPGSPLKMALAITNPHEEIMRYIVPNSVPDAVAAETDKETAEKISSAYNDELIETVDAAVIETDVDDINVEEIIEEIEDRPEFNDTEEEK
jgi:ethanolamine utilization protein EutM